MQIINRTYLVGMAGCAVTARAERAEHTRYNVQPHRLRRWTRRGQRSALSLPKNNASIMSSFCQFSFALR